MWIAFPPKINLLFSSWLTRNVVVFASSNKFRFSTSYGLTTANLQRQCLFEKSYLPIILLIQLAAGTATSLWLHLWSLNVFAIKRAPASWGPRACASEITHDVVTELKLSVLTNKVQQDNDGGMLETKKTQLTCYRNLLIVSEMKASKMAPYWTRLKQISGQNNFNDF